MAIVNVDHFHIVRCFLLLHLLGSPVAPTGPLVVQKLEIIFIFCARFYYLMSETSIKVYFNSIKSMIVVFKYAPNDKNETSRNVRIGQPVDFSHVNKKKNLLRSAYILSIIGSNRIKGSSRWIVKAKIRVLTHHNSGQLISMKSRSMTYIADTNYA